MREFYCPASEKCPPRSQLPVGALGLLSISPPHAPNFPYSPPSTRTFPTSSPPPPPFQDNEYGNSEIEAPTGEDEDEYSGDDDRLPSPRGSHRKKPRRKVTLSRYSCCHMLSNAPLFPLVLLSCMLQLGHLIDLPSDYCKPET